MSRISKDQLSLFEPVVETVSTATSRTTYSGKLNASNMPANGVFVPGTNPLGINGAGAAKVARDEFGAGNEKLDNKFSSNKKV